MKKDSTKPESIFSGFKLSDATRREQIDIMRDQLKTSSQKSKSFLEKLNNGVHSSLLWGRKHDLKKSVEKSGIRDNMKVDEEINPPLQNMNEKPLFIGADVESLYPNLDREITGQLMYKAVMEFDVKFHGIDYERLAIYLYLVLGLGVMTKCDLGDCAPVRVDSTTSARSLGARSNREMSEWRLKS